MLGTPALKCSNNATDRNTNTIIFLEKIVSLNMYFVSIGILTAMFGVFFFFFFLFEINVGISTVVRTLVQ